MIRRLENFPSQVIAFLCSGRVTKSEYDSVLIPAVENALQTHRRLRLYYETSSDFSIAPGAAWEDFKLGVEHITRWERIVVVTDVEWIGHTIHAFSFLLPRRLQVFPSTEAERARAWIIAERVS